jgi:DNA gyrase subunit A
MAETITTVSLRQETEERYLTYAMSVITSRALPDVRDGLKPVQRRILYTMYHDLHLTFDGRPRKCAKICGDVTGNYHPHGTVAAYEALVRMAQPWMMRVPLVHGQGNFGSVDGDPPAADRYTEAKLTGAAEPLLLELGQHTVSMRPNYDNTRQEPVVLPAQFPNLLVNGAAGIAVGLATNIAPHNLGEVCRAAVLLIDNPDATTAVLMDRIKGPDFPLGGRVVTDRTTLRKIYEEGTGTIKVQAEWKVEEAPGRKQQIVITSIPYGVDKGKLEELIGQIISERKLPQLVNLVNESNEKDGLRIVLEIKPGSDPELIMAYLYKHTPLQDTFPVNMTCLVPQMNSRNEEITRPMRLGLKEMLQYFLDFRLETVRRRFEYELEQLRRRIHILEGFQIIFNALDRAIKIIRQSSGKQDAAEKLIKEFKIDEEQATAVLDAQLYKIAQMEIQKILDELEEKKKRAEEISALLRSKKRLWGVVKDELTTVGETYGKDRRRTRMGSSDEVLDFDPEHYIVQENANVVLTRDGWIKRVERLAAVEKTRVREGDEVTAVVPGSTRDHVVFLADDGTAYTMRIVDVPASSGYGDPITKFFRLDDGVKIVGLITTDERFTLPDQPPKKGAKEGDDPPGPYILVATAQGQVLRTPLSAFRTESTKVGRRYARLNVGDRIVLAGLLRDETSLFLVSQSGHVIHFAIDEVNILAGAGKGVIGIKLEEGDVCLGGLAVTDRHDNLLVQTSDGKTMDFRSSRGEMVSRGGKGYEAVKRRSFVRVIPPPIQLTDWEAVECNGKEKEKPNGEKNAEKNGERTLFD